MADSTVVYECQAKKSLSNDGRLADAADKFAKLAATPMEQGILIVDSLSSRTITSGLLNALEAWRDRTAPAIKGALETVHGQLAAAGAVSVLERLSVRVFDIEGDASPDTLNALLMLEPLLKDPSMAGAAWRVLISDGLTLCRTGGKRNRDAIVALLEQEHLYLVENQSAGGASLPPALLAEFHSLSTQISTLQPSQHAPGPDQFGPQLDAAKAYLVEGRYQSALDLLDVVGPLMRSSGAPARSRMHNQRGAALSNLGRTAEAIIEVEKALALTPEDAVVLANRAHLAMAADERDEAIRFADQAIEKDPISPGAWSVIAQMDLTRVIPVAVLNDPTMLATRGVALIKNNKPAEGIDLLRQSLAAGFNAERALWFARAALEQALGHWRTASTDPSVAEARTLLDQVLASPFGVSGGSLRESALITRGHIHTLLGAPEAAREDCETVFREYPGALDARIILGTHYIDHGEPEKALFLADAGSAAEGRPILFALKAQALTAMNRLSEARDAIECAEQARDKATDNPDHRAFLAELALDADAVDLAERLVQQPGQPEWRAAAFAARIASRRGQDDAVRIGFDAALTSAPQEERMQLRGEFAAYLRANGDSRHAVSILEAGLPLASDQLRALYGRVLFEAHEFGKVAALIESLRGEDEVTLPTWAMEIGANLALLRDDVPAAVRYLEALAVESPDHAELAIRLAQMLLRSNDTVRALSVMDRLREQANMSSRQMLQLASLYIRAGVQDPVLPLAYKALRLEPDAEDIQLTYVNFFVKRAQTEEEFETPVVAADTAVVLQMAEGTERRFFIVTDHPPRRRAGELAVTDPMVVMLLGHRAGDRIPLRAGAFNEEVATVKEVLSKYVHASQSIMLEYEELHPLGTALKRFPVPENPRLDDFAPITANLQLLAEKSEALLAKYREGGLPLGVLAASERSSLVDAYDFVRSSESQPLLTEFGNAIEASCAAAKSATPAVVTRTALHTARYLSLWDAITTLHPALIAPQSLLDEMETERIHLRDSARTGHLGLVYREGRSQTQSAPPEYFQRLLKQCEDAMDWVRKHCEIRPRPLHRLTEKDEKMREAIGASSFDSVALAEDCGAEMFADDLGLRRYLHALTGRFGFSTYGLLLAGRGTLFTDEQFDEHVVTLVRLNHVSLLFTADMFSAAFRRNAYRFDGQMVPLLNRLRDPEIELANIVHFIAHTLMLVSLTPGSVSHLGPLTYSMVEAGAHGRDARHLIAIVERVVKIRMQLLPLELDAIMGALQRYAAFAIGGAPLLVS